MKNQTLLIVLASFLILHSPLSTAQENQENQGSWSTQKLGLEGLELTTAVYTPTITRESLRPLVVVLHGCVQKISTLQKQANLEETAIKTGSVILLPQVPNGGVYLGCWDYYGEEQGPELKHTQALLGMIQSVIKDEARKIDPNRVYVAGLSSGAGQAQLLACSAPDLFAGLALASSPALTTSAGDITKAEAAPAKVAEFCRKLAGSKASAFASQLATVVYASNDQVVDPAYGPLVAKSWQMVFGLPTEGETKMETTDLSTLPGASPEGKQEIFGDADGARLSLIEHRLLGHNWPAGKGGRSKDYIAGKGLNFMAYFMSFFETHNRRVKKTTP